MAMVLGRQQAVCTSPRGVGRGDAKRTACEAWFALNRHAYQTVLNMAIQAELNMTSAEVTSHRLRDDVTTYQEPQLDLMASNDMSLTPGKSCMQK